MAMLFSAEILGKPWSYAKIKPESIFTSRSNIAFWNWALPKYFIAEIPDFYAKYVCSLPLSLLLLNTQHVSPHDLLSKISLDTKNRATSIFLARPTLYFLPTKLDELTSFRFRYIVTKNNILLSAFGKWFRVFFPPSLHFCM